MTDPALKEPSEVTDLPLREGAASVDADAQARRVLTWVRGGDGEGRWSWRAWQPRPERLLRWLIALVTALTALYYGGVASDLYVSESAFVLRSSEKQAATGLMGMLLPVAAHAGAQEETHVVYSYMQSRDALHELEGPLQLKQAYSDDAIDRLSRFPALDFDDSDEAFFRYWRNQVNVELDSNSSVSVLRVGAFDARLAQRMNERLLALSEKLVNQLNARIRDDAIRFASAEVTRAEQHASTVARELAAYRSGHSVVDPERQSALQLTQAEKIQEELIAARAQLSQIEAVSPDNPQIPSLKARIRRLRTERGGVDQAVTGRSGSLVQKTVEMQRLLVQQDSANRQLAAALTLLEQARNEAQRKQLYLERIAAPHLPDAPAQPRRVRAVITTVLLGLLAWGLSTLVLAAVREHQD